MQDKLAYLPTSVVSITTLSMARTRSSEQAVKKWCTFGHQVQEIQPEPTYTFKSTNAEIEEATEDTIIVKQDDEELLIDPENIIAVAKSLEECDNDPRIDEDDIDGEEIWGETDDSSSDLSFTETKVQTDADAVARFDTIITLF